MIRTSRRRLTFQLTPLLDLLLIVIFAQYMEVRATARTQAREAAGARERLTEYTSEIERLETTTEQLADLRTRVADLETENAELEASRDLARDRQRRLVERFAEALRLNEETLAAALAADDPGTVGLTEEEREKLRKRLREILETRGTEALEHLVTYEELRKRADVWRVRVGNLDEPGVVTVTAGDRTRSFRGIATPEEFVDEVFEFYKGLPQPKSHVVILMNYDSRKAELFTLQAVRSGLPRLVSRMQADGDSRFFWAEIGYDPRVLGLPE